MKLPNLALCASLAFAFAPAPSLAQEAAVAPAPQEEAVEAAPALWKVADEDTTVYLFGTIHILPRNVSWFGGEIEEALASSDILVTEIPAEAMNDSSMQAVVMQKAMLGGGKTLRSLLDAEQRATYEAGMRSVGIPAEAFDQFEPWFAGVTLAILPLVKAGYDPNSGVEEVLEAVAPETMDRGALETAEEQLDMLDNLPVASQIEFLISAAEDPDRTIAQADEMLNFWLTGDAEGLAELMNEEMDDPTLASVLLFDRNERWADWIKTRMKRPGTVFIAVGAAHLAGEKSVQDFLSQRELEVTRVQ